MKKVRPIILSLIVLLILYDVYAKVITVSAKITVIYGKAKVLRAGKNRWINAYRKMKLFPGDKIRTGKKTKIEIRFIDGSIIRLADNSEMEISRLERDEKNKQNNTGLRAKVGNFWTRIKQVAGYKNNFEVTTPTAVAGVRGTVYRMEIKEDTTTMVRVYKGKVEVRTWLEIYEDMVKPRGEKEEKIEEEPKKEGRYEIEGPVEVEGPTEVSLEEWIRIVKSMQQIVIAPDKMPEDPKGFDAEEDAKDEWVKWNKERDAYLEKIGE